MLNDKLSSYLERKSTKLDFEAVAIKLNEIILASDNTLESDIKWNRLTFAANGDFHHWICAIDITKKKVNLVFHFGGLLNDEDKLLIAGSSKFIRKMEFENCKEIDTEIINSFITQAINKLPFFIKNWKEMNRKD